MSFHPLAELSELHDGYRQVFSWQGREFILLQEEGQRFCIENRCPHMDQPLLRGTVDNGTISCPSHGIEFCLNTGEPQSDVAQGCVEALLRLPLSRQGDSIGLII